MLFVTLATATVTSCSGSPEQAVVAEITAFEPHSGVLQPGGPATVSVRLKNTGTEDRTLWIGYSV